MDDIAVSEIDAGSPVARHMLVAYFAELAARFPAGFDSTGAVDQATAAFNPPLGLFVMAGTPESPLGCGGVQFLDDERGEIERMWVAPAARGKGVATRLLGYLEKCIAESGRSTVVLDTNETLTEAIALYERRGYRRIERYNDNPHAQLWFAKPLDPCDSRCTP